MADTALVLIATGKLYWQYLNPMLESAHKYFIPHDAIVWTDYKGPIVVSDGGCIIPWTAQGFPYTTLFRYHTFLTERKRLEKYKHIFYVDVDAFFSDYVKPEEILTDGITATLHAGYYKNPPTNFPLEKNQKSAAYLETCRNYFAGGFVGGSSKDFLNICEAIQKGVDADRKINHMAIWHDESHLNRHLYDHPPAKILGPEFCYSPGLLNILKPKITLIEKPARTQCLYCEEPAVKWNLCKKHSERCIHAGCTQPILRSGICGHHLGCVQLRTSGRDSHIKWCTWPVAERLEKIGMGAIIRDND